MSEPGEVWLFHCEEVGDLIPGRCHTEARCMGSCNEREHYCDCKARLYVPQDIERSEIVGELVDSQAELQTALGIYRLGRGQLAGVRDFDPYVECRMRASLAMQHELLARLGHPMGQPAQMPEGWTPA